MEEDGKIPIYGELVSGTPGGYVTDLSQIRGMDKVVSSTQNDIIVAGGPLEDDVKDNWPDEWKDKQGNKVIPTGTTLETALKALFLKRKVGEVSWGSIIWKPKLGDPSLSLSQSGTVEVGTKITVTTSCSTTVSDNDRTCSLIFDEDCGYFIEDKDWSNQPYKKKISGSTISGSPKLNLQVERGTLNNDGTFTVGEGVNKITVIQTGNSVTCNKLPAVTAYASTNTKEKIERGVVLNDNEETSKMLSSSTTMQITGVRYIFWGVDYGSNALDSDYIRNNHKGNRSNAGTYDIDAKGYRRIWIAIPPNRKLTSFYNTSLGTDMGDVLSLTKKETVSIKGANEYKADTYDVFTYTSDADFESVYKITIK